MIKKYYDYILLLFVFLLFIFSSNINRFLTAINPNLDNSKIVVDYNKYLKDELDSIRIINDINDYDNLDLIVSRVKYRNVYEYSDTLKNLGIDVVNQGFSNEIERFNPDSVIYSVAIKENDTELVWARNNNKKIFNRGEALGIITSEYKNVICISGSHGKTTTTALLTNIFNVGKLDFSAHIGGQSLDINGNLRLGRSHDYFITEACEYFDSFLIRLQPVHYNQCPHPQQVFLALLIFLQWQTY